jgi:tagatose 6-phosphate kinase
MLFCLGTTPTVQRSMFFDRLTPDAVNRAAEVREYASGKSINVARVAHQLGQPVMAGGFVGSGRDEFFLRELEKDGVRHDFVAVDAPLRTCTTVVDRATNTATELVEESSPVEAEKWPELLQKIEALGADSTWWVLSGSLPPGAPQDFYGRCLELAHRRGVTVLLDARGEPLREALKWPGFIAKLNREELAATVGHALDDESALRTAMEQARPRDGTIVVTLGAQGAIVSDGRETWRVTPPRVTAISAVGSGDAFSAGMAVALLRGKSLPDALVLAAACGTANAMTPWAGFVRIKDVRELEPRVKVEAVVSRPG